MEENEDEPVDVQQATPVDIEVKKGENDEESNKPRESYGHGTSKLHKCPEKSSKIKKPVKTKEECCKSKLEKRTKGPKTATVFIYEKPCTLPKLDIIPRHCLSKGEWMNLLATPSRKCPPPCLKKTEERPLRPVSARMNQLALPPRQRMLATLQDRGTILPAELVDKLINVLEAESCLTPEQAEKFFRDKPKKKNNKNRKNKEENCTGELKKSEEIKIIGSPYDEKAVNCQYSIAETFVKSILQWESTIPKEEFRDIAEVIIKRLENILEYPALEDGDRMTQQMRFLSDIIASWIAGVLFEVAETEKEELEKQCEEARKAKEEETDESSDDNSEDEIFIEPTRKPRKKRIKEEEKEKEDDNENSLPLMKEIKKERRDDDEDDNGGTPQGAGSARSSGARHSDLHQGSEAKESQSQENKKESNENVKDEPQDADDINTLSYADALKKTQIDDESENNGNSIESIDQDVLKKNEVEDILKTPDDSIQPIERSISKTVTFADTLGKSDEENAIQPIDEATSKGAKIDDILGEISIPRLDDDTYREHDITNTEGHLSQIPEIKREMIDEDISVAEVPLEEISYSNVPENEIKISEVSSQSSEVKIPIRETSSVGVKDIKSEFSENIETEVSAVKSEELEEFDTRIDRIEEESVSQIERMGVHESTPEIVESELVNSSVSQIEKDKVGESADVMIKEKVLESSTFEIKIEKNEQQSYEASHGTVNADNKLVKSSVLETQEKNIEEPSSHEKIPYHSNEYIQNKGDKFMPISGFNESLKSDIPFINFLKIFDTIESVVQKEAENIGDDPMIDRLHRTVYEKFEHVVNAETPEKLTEHMKDMLDVLSGKIAIFLRKILTDSQIIFLESNPPQVESGELRESAKWIRNILNMANVWNTWLQTVIQEAADMSTVPTTRGEWQNWKKKVQDEALLFRRFHLESVHQAHHNRTMLSGRGVVKTGELKYPDYTIVEREIKTTDFWH